MDAVGLELAWPKLNKAQAWLQTSARAHSMASSSGVGAPAAGMLLRHGLTGPLLAPELAGRRLSGPTATRATRISLDSNESAVTWRHAPSEG